MLTYIQSIDPTAATVALVMMALDIVLGLAGAIKNSDVRSAKMRAGLWHKCGSIGLIVLAFVLEYAAAIMQLGFEVPGVIVVCIYIVLMEAGSCLENLVVLNPELKDNPVMRVFAHCEDKPEKQAGQEATNA